MTNTFWQRVSYFLGLLSIAVLFGLVVFSANIEIKDLDLWLHLKMGEYIVQHKYVPDVDVLSCTIAGKPWVNHEWLFQVLAYLIYHNGGAEGLIAMQVFVVSFTLLVLLLLGYNKEKQFGITFLLLLIMLVYQTRFTIRPDIFSLLFFAFYIYILALHIDKRWSIYAIFIIQVLWANFHGFFFFGPFIILVGITAETLKRRTKLPWQWNKSGRLSDDEFQNLKKIFIIAILASLVNPLTFRGAWYPISVLINITGESRIFFSHIQELQRPLTWGTLLATGVYPYYKVLILISFMGFIFNRRKIDIGDFFVWLVFLSVSLIAVRNLVFFAFVAYLVSMTNYGSMSWKDIAPISFINQKFQHITVCLLKVLLIVWMLNYGSLMSLQGYFDFDKYELKSSFGGITQRNYPSKAADFLVANNIKGNFFNDFNSGAYTIGRCYPNIRVFIDGRTEVYGPEFFKYYAKIWNKNDISNLPDAIERYHLTGALLNSIMSAIPEKIISYFYNNKDWVVVYFDYDAVIFLKDVPENREIISKFRIDLSKWKPEKMDLKRLGPRFIPPFPFINRSFTLESLGLDDVALEEAREAVRILPSEIGAYKIMGKIYGKKKDFEKAFENFRIAAMYAPGDSEVRSNLALAYLKIGDYEHAIRQYNAIVRNNPKDPKGYFLFAKAYAEDGQWNEALSTLKKGFGLDSRAVSDVLEIGDVVFGKKKFNEALEFYKIALMGQKDMAKTYYKIGRCYQAVGQADQARDAFQKGLAIDPSNEDLKKGRQEL